MERKGKAESIRGTLCLERGWENPSAQSDLIVTPSRCLRQGDFLLLSFFYYPTRKFKVKISNFRDKRMIARCRFFDRLPLIMKHSAVSILLGQKKRGKTFLARRPGALGKNSTLPSDPMFQGMAESHCQAGTTRICCPSFDSLRKPPGLFRS